MRVGLQTMIKKYLLDTHILIWWLADDSRLSQKVRDILENPDNFIFVSVVNAWEMSIKLKTDSNQLAQGKKLKLSIGLQECFLKTGFEVLPIKLEHAFAIKELSTIHKDPFDRMLIAQAISEECVLISADKKIGRYPEVTVVE